MFAKRGLFGVSGRAFSIGRSIVAIRRVGSLTTWKTGPGARVCRHVSSEFQRSLSTNSSNSVGSSEGTFKTNPSVEVTDEIYEMVGQLNPVEKKCLKHLTNPSVEVTDEIYEMVGQLNPVEKKCLKHFTSGAMSFGSISLEAHSDIAIGVNSVALALAELPASAQYHHHGDPLYPMSNSGEGGELPVRSGTMAASRIRQVASGRFGVDGNYLAHASMLQIKIAQGAKPGIGGELPGSKVTAAIAAARKTAEGVRLVSPPPHHDIYSVEDLKQLIYDLRSANPVAAISVKLAATDGLGVIAAGCVKAGANNISITGSGGSGATPMTAKYEFVQDAESSLAEVHRMLVQEGLRNSCTLTVAGGLQTGLDFFKFILLGADFIELGTSMLIALGCTMAEVCHKGTCPTGIATTDADLISRKYRGSPIHVARLLINNAKSLARYVSLYGFTSPKAAVGRTDLLKVREFAPVTGLEALLEKPQNPYYLFQPLAPVVGSSSQEIEILSRVVNGEQTSFRVEANNQILSCGARFNYARFKDRGLQEVLDRPGGVTVEFVGAGGAAPGQSFGFCAPAGLTLIADWSNDGTAKSLDGANVYCRVSAGSTVGYGATSGFFCSRFVGDRAFVRNSGLNAVVETMGAMACNFMTGGRVTILGAPQHYDWHLLSGGASSSPPAYQAPVWGRGTTAVGPNFGAGFSGGIVLMPKILHEQLLETQHFANQISDLEPLPLSDRDAAVLHNDLSVYCSAIDMGSRNPRNSEFAQALLDSMALGTSTSSLASQFVKLEPASRPRTSLPFQLEFSPRESLSELAASSYFVRLSAKNDTQTPPAASSGKRQPSTSKPASFVDSCGTGLVRAPIVCHETVARGLEMLARMSHRGARGIDPDSGDGCGVALFSYHNFFMHKFPSIQKTLSNANFGVVSVALPLKEPEVVDDAVALLSSLFEKHGLMVLAARLIPTDEFFIGYLGKMAQLPAVQLVVAPCDGSESRTDTSERRVDGGDPASSSSSLVNVIREMGTGDVQSISLVTDETAPKSLASDTIDRIAFERQLTRVRVVFEMEMENKQVSGDLGSRNRPHVFSSSTFHIIYKGLCTEHNFGRFFPDLMDHSFTALASVSHSRFATNTLPQLKNVQPIARLANNGENNTVGLLRRRLTCDPWFAEALGVPKVNLHSEVSDSFLLGLVIDAMHLGGMSLERIVESSVLPVHFGDQSSSLVSQFFNLTGIPFEGPNASIIFLNNQIAVVRDRNGFRPQRGFVSDQGWIYVGSELGASVRFAGQHDMIDLAPATPMIVDLEAGTHRLHTYDEQTRERCSNAMLGLRQLRKLPPSTLLTSEMDQDQLLVVKQRAGWSMELERAVLNPLFELGSGATTSMGDQGPLEAFVRGSYFDLNNFFKAHFSQVTNPPLARNEEQSYMSTEVVCGPFGVRSVEASASGASAPVALDGNGQTPFFLPSPLVDNQEIAQLAEGLSTAYIDATFVVGEREEGLTRAIERVSQEALVAVRDNGHQLVILTDASVTRAHADGPERAPIPPTMIASVVDAALMQAGCRDSASLAIQASQLLSGAHIAQCISIGGADVVNPYLIFASIDDRRQKNYKRAIRQELLGFMARIGVSSLTAYRGSKSFSAIGLSDEVADLYGLHSTLGGLSLQDVSRILLTNHRFVLEQGIGKYEWLDQTPRTKIWNARTTNAYIKMARGLMDQDQFSQVERQTNIIKSGWPRGWLKLQKPVTISDRNPMNVCVLGGGAAAFFTASRLLESKVPVRVFIVEKRHVNKFGLLGDGIAPDHEATRRANSAILRQLYDHPRVHYYGGISVGDNEGKVTLQRLREIFPAVIDARGANEDRRLGIPGETESSRVLTASQIYSAYNGEFDPENPNKDWPFSKKSKNPVTAIIGGGNVAADLARIFIKDPDLLAGTSINPVFLDYLRFESPNVVRIFIRGDPWTSKIGLKELKELESLGVWISASFEQMPTETEELSDDMLALYEFFLKYRLRQVHGHERDAKRLYFHFQRKPIKISEVGNEVKIEFESNPPEGSVNEPVVEEFRAANVVTALGKLPPKISSDGLVDFSAGWSTGLGGTLAMAEQSAEETVQEFVRHYDEGRFQSRVAGQQQLQTSIFDEPWMLRAVSNQEAVSILEYLDGGNEIRTVGDFRRAKVHKQQAHQSQLQTESQGVSADASAAPVDPGTEDIASTADGVTIVKPSGERVVVPATGGEESLLKTLDQFGLSPPAECDGELVCGTCFVAVQKEGNQPIERSRKEIALLKANDAAPKTTILSCNHSVKSLAGSVVKIL